MVMINAGDPHHSWGWVVIGCKRREAIWGSDKGVQDVINLAEKQPLIRLVAVIRVGCRHDRVG